MTKYAYPAIFTKEDSGYSINFPDLEGCYTCGSDMEDGIKMMRVFVDQSGVKTRVFIMAHHLVGDGKSMVYFIERVMND